MKTTMLTLTTAFLAVTGLSQATEPARVGSQPQLCSASSEAGFTLTKDNLGQVLANLGLRPEKVNEKRYRMAIERGGIKFTITASVSDDGTELWLNTYVAEVSDIAKLPSGVMDKLLTASNDYGPAHFTFTAGEKPGVRSVYLHRALDNRGLNPAMIREALDNLASDVVSTRPIWSLLN
jgi:hypothetical protein